MATREQELLNIIKASAMGDACFEHILGFIRVGMTEKTIATEIDNTLRKLGGQRGAFPTICVSGKRTVLPHGEPGEKTIEVGDFLTMDYGTVVNGYCGDMTRTVAIGKVSEKQKKVYHLVREAQELGLKLLRPGMSSRFVDTQVRNLIEKEGYGKFFVHGTGHGVGQEVHETPYIHQRTDSVLKEHMAVTVEPGIYIPGEFGVRIEDLAIITSFGIINTVKSPKELIIL